MKRTSLRLSALLPLIVVFLFVFSSCGQDGGGGGSAPTSVGNAARLTEDDFEVESVKELSAADFRNSLDGNSGFQNISESAKISPDGGSEPSMSTLSLASAGTESDSCVDDKIAAVFERGQGGAFKAGLDNKELKSCFQSDESLLSMRVSFAYKGVKFRDSTGAEVDLDGRDVDDVFESSAYSPAQFNFRSYERREEIIDNKTVVSTILTSVGGSSDFDDPCLISADNVVSRCKIRLVHKVVFSDGSKFNNRMVLTLDNVTANPEDEYFTNGSVDFVINDWTGTMVYDEDGSTPPRYQGSKGSENVSGAYKKISLFDERATGILSSSLIDFPRALTPGSDESGEDSMKNIDFSLPEYNGRDLNLDSVNFQLDPVYPIEPTNEDEGEFHELSREYIGAAQETREKILMFIQSFISNLAMLREDMLPVEFPESLLERFDLYKIVIEESPDSDYTWKIGMYYSADSEAPEAALFLSINSTETKGRFFIKMENEDDQYAAAVGVNGLSMVKKAEAVFALSGDIGTFEFKYVGDRSTARAYAAANWEALSDATRDALTKIAEKVFVRIGHDQTSGEFNVCGAAYHPGWGLLEELEGQSMWNDRERTLYMFKAKSSKSERAAKMIVALPRENSDGVGLWENDSAGKIFSDALLSRLNRALFRLNDESNDFPPTAANPSYDPPNTPPLYAGSEYTEKLKAVVIYDCVMGNCVLAGPGDMIPDNPGAVVSPERLRSFVYSPPVEADLFTKIIDLHTRLRAVGYMSGPAFFRDDMGLVGTYNDNVPGADDGLFYRYSYSAGNFGFGSSDKSLIEGCLNYSLDGFDCYSPSDLTADIALE